MDRLEHIIDNYKLYFPGSYEKTERYEMLDEWRVAAYLDGGFRLIYDDFTRTVDTVQTPMDTTKMTREEYMDNFSRKLYNTMQRKGYTQTKLSMELGISRSTINGYMNAKTLPDIYTIRALAKVLGCTVDYLTSR